MTNYRTINRDDFNLYTDWFRNQLPEFHTARDGILVDLPAHLVCATDFTKYGKRNYTNRRSYRAVERIFRDIRSERAEDVIEKQSSENLSVSAI